MQKISKLTLKNFKFFYGEASIEFERKNVLIYGENGSGKSSIYWALFTFFQSVLKTDVQQVQKYFIEHEQSLRNRFAADDQESLIEIAFEDEASSVTTKRVSGTTVNTRTGTLVKNANQSSDFINYRLLSKIYDFSNRDSIDLFPLFERELLMFITFESEFQKIDGSAGNANAHEWWEYIKNGLNPRPKRMSDEPYKIFSKNVSQFNIELEKYLFNIIEAANKYLQQKFKQPYKLKFEYGKSTYDAFIPGTTSRDHKTLPPKIILKVDFIHDLLPELKGDLRRPHTFLNEARLSTIALSLRFAILDEKYIEVAPKVLVLDDLLISLDMSNRDIVLELILNEFKKYQIIIMTHDRTFFNLTKRRLELENCIKDWVVKEIYQDETDTGIPIPFIPQDNNYYQQAKKYLKAFDYPACANYLRKETERILKTLLPINLTIYTKEDEGSKPLPLDQLIENFKAHYISFGGDFSSFKKLKEHKDLLLNPLSHDNIDTPIYKQELISVFSILDKLKRLEFKTLISIADNADTFMFIVETANDGEKWSYKIKLKEHLRTFKKLDGTWALNNPECSFVARKRTSDGHIDNFERNVKLNQGYSNIRHALQIDANLPNDLWEIIKNSDNKKLRDLI